MIKMSTSNRICILGGPGTGKTTLVRKRFEQSLAENLDVKWILPTAGLVQHTKDLILSPDGPAALVENRILTFQDWAGLLLGNDETVARLPDLVVLVKRIIQEIRPEGYSNVIDLPGFARTLTGAAKELLENGIAPEKLFAMGGKRSAQLEALGQIAQALSKQMQQHRLVLSGQLLFRLAKQIETAKQKTPQLLLMDGFYDFTCAQNACVIALANNCKAMIMTLPATVSDLERKSFLTVFRTYTFLKGLSFNFEQAQGAPRGNDSVISSIFSNLFENEPFVDPSDKVTVLEGDTHRGLINGIARQILADKKSGAIKHWRDAGIICRTLSPWAETIKETFEELGIPVSINGALEPSLAGPGPALLSLLTMIGEKAPESRVEKYAASHRLLNLSCLLVTQKSAAELKRLLAFNRDNDDKKRITPESDLNALVEQATDPETISLLHFLSDYENYKSGLSLDCERFHHRAKALIRRFAGATFSGSNLDMPGMEIAAKVVKAFVNGLDQYLANALLLDQEEKSWATHVENFLTFLNVQSVPLSKRYADAVHVVDVMESRSWVWKHSYLLGLVEGEFPRRIHEDIYCKDNERETLHALLPTSKSTRREEELLFCLAATRATHRLTIGQYRFNDEGKEAAPSIFFEELNSLFATPMPVEKLPASLGRPVFDDSGWVIKNHAHQAAAFSLGRLHFFNEVDNENNQAGKFLFENRLAGNIFPMDPASFIHPHFHEYLDDDFLPVVKYRFEPFSISSVRTFAQCSFKSFAARLLALAGPPRPPILDQRIMGTIAHETLKEYFTKRKIDSDKQINIHALFRALSNSHLEGMDIGFDEKQDLLRLEGALNVLIEMENDRWQEQMGAVPTLFEWEFGSRNAPVMLEHDGKTMPFTGRIDRVDELNGGLLVIDYKLSTGAFGKQELDEIAQGVLPQLPIYLKAAEAVLHQKPVGAQLEAIKKVSRSGFGNNDLLTENAAAVWAEDKCKLLDTKEFEALLTEAIAGVFGFCEKMLAGQIAARPRDSAKTCGYGVCDYYDICRIEL